MSRGAALTSEADAARWLLSAGAVRQRAQVLLARLERGDSAHFIYHPEKLAATIALVQISVRANYPTLAIPFHSRWRHFEAGGTDRWAELAGTLKNIECAGDVH